MYINRIGSGMLETVSIWKGSLNIRETAGMILKEVLKEGRILEEPCKDLGCRRNIKGTQNWE